MGAVNYHTSKYVTLGLEPYGFDEYTDENGETDFDERWEDMEVDAMKETAAEYDWVRRDHDFTIDDEETCYYGLFTGREIREENEKHSVTFK